MFDNRVSRVLSRWTVLATFTVFLGLAPAFAGDHELRMESIMIGDGESHLKAGCENWLSASFSVHGVDDYLVRSGEIEIRFSYRSGASDDWHLIETLPVTFRGLLVIGTEWPPASTPEPSAISFVAPSNLGSIDLKAAVGYTNEDIDDVNELVRQVAIVHDESCGLQARICVHCLKLWICDRIVPQDPLYAELLGRWNEAEVYDGSLIEVRPRLCGLVECPSCIAGLSCEDEPFVLHFSQAADLRITLYGNGQPVAEASRLQRPLELEGKTFNYRLDFEARQGVSYRLVVAPAAGTQEAVRALLPIDMRLRRAGMKAE